jgi:hypothetical protein
VLVPVAEGGAVLAVGHGFVAEPDGGDLVGLASGGEVLVGEREGEAGGEVLLVGVVGGRVEVGGDVAVEPAAELGGHAGGHGEEAGPEGEDVGR